MPNIDEGLKQELLETDDEYRRLFEEHQNYKRRLEELHQKSFLSPDDEHEAKQIKLHKLGLKDRMELILRSRRETRATA
ncbi:MAG: DUF465 domain-containing protein [Acidobacteriota bacterium]|nr:DUF465 domain-containing protein [Acidobacteriota bacterium]